MTAPYCAICRRHVDMGQRHVEIDAETLAEDAPEQEHYIMHTRCWDHVASGWGRSG